MHDVTIALLFSKRVKETVETKENANACVFCPVQ